MKYLSYLSQTIFLVTLCSPCLAWIIDTKSCGNHDENDPNNIQKKLRVALDSAFSMASSPQAPRPITLPMNRANSVVQDYDNGDDNFKNLFGYLFVKDHLQAVKDVFTKMTRQDITDDNPTKMDVKNAIIYCDLERYEGRDAYGTKFLWDTDIEQRYGFWTPDMKTCKEATSPPLTGGHLAYTDSGKGLLPSQVTICPWYLKKMLSGPPFESKTAKKDKVLAWLKENIWQKLPKTSTKMDTWALLDHTLAHEFTHSWKGGETNLLDDDLGRKEQYEWNGITKDDVKAWGHENADNFAYYALGVRMIQDPTPFIVQKNGDLKPKDNKPPKRWLGMPVPWRA